MKKMNKSIVVLAALCLLLLAGAARHAEARRHHERRRSKDDYTLFIFGDSFVDVGNVRKADPSRRSRGWYKPYGSHDSAHGNAPTGRLSDGLVQSDYLAKMLGGDESPPPYRQIGHDASGGVNFAVPFSGALNGAEEQLSLDGQVGQFRRLLNRGTIADAYLEDSVALVSISTHDYSHLSDSTSTDDVNSYIRDVTDEIADAVDRLLDLGVSKVLVNSMPPLGCSPWRSRIRNGDYAQCDTAGNTIAATHNTLLKQKLGELKGDALMLDLYTAFGDAAQSKSSLSSTPCCEAGVDGYCGQEDASGKAQYSVCSSPSRYFYWDYVHPTQDGWKAVMDQIEPAIQDFLGI